MGTWPEFFLELQSPVMFVMHIALGGCLKAPPVNYGLTEDTGGHIAYVLGAAAAQAAREDVERVEIVTRAFDDPRLGAVHAAELEAVSPGVVIRRLRTATTAYLSKDELHAEVPALVEAFLAHLASRKRLPNVIHAHFADAARLAHAAQRRFGIPFIYTPHSLGSDKRAAGDDAPALRTRIDNERTAIMTADALIVSSRDEAERQLAAYGCDAEGRTCRINPGVTLPAASGTAEAEALLSEHLTRPELPVILAIARPVRKKNLEGLLAAYAASPALQDKANLVILAGQDIGLTPADAEQNEVRAALRDMVATAGLEGKVALPACHAPELVPQLYRVAARQGGVFANPAFHEPFGLTLIEAAQFGLPVVATQCGGPSDILRTLGHGLSVDPHDRDGIAAACERLIDDSDLWHRHSANALKGASVFSWQDWAAEATEIAADLHRPVVSFPEQPSRFFVFDIDNTLTGCRRGAEDFALWARGHGDGYAVATGRSLAEARRILREWKLPEPRVFITSVGSEIWRRRIDGRLTLCRAYARKISPGWEPERIARVLARAGAVPQDHHEQRQWKLSYVGDTMEGRRVEQILLRAGVVARVIASHGRFIDVLPVRAGKWGATSFELSRLGLSVADCVAAGDSGNDADLLAASGSAIVVSNARPELVLSDRPGLYRARARYASGVMEGLRGLGLADAPARGHEASVQAQPTLVAAE